MWLATVFSLFEEPLPSTVLPPIIAIFDTDSISPKVSTSPAEFVSYNISRNFILELGI